MPTSPRTFRWQHHPLVLATGVLLLVCGLMVTQKYLRYADSSNYDLSLSLIYNLVTIVPFSLCVAAGLIVRRLTSAWTLNRRVLVIATTGVALLALYALTISGVLYGIGLSRSFPSQAFLSKYVTGPLHVHAAIFALMQFVPFSTRTSRPKTAATTPTEIFGIPVDNVLAIEADDHYVWFRTREGSVLERITMRDLARQLPEQFIRVHRSHIVNLDKVDGLKKAGRYLHLRVDERLIPVSASYRAGVMEQLPSRVPID